MTLRKLASGTLVDVDEQGQATFVACDWLVRVPSGNPEPDSPADCWKEVECGARIKCLTNDPEVGWRCEAGDERWPYGTRREEELALRDEARALQDEGYYQDALRLSLNAGIA